MCAYKHTIFIVMLTVSQNLQQSEIYFWESLRETSYTTKRTNTITNYNLILSQNLQQPVIHF